MDLEATTLSLMFGVVVLGALAIVLLRRRQLSVVGREELKLALSEGQHVPPSLHPVIDATLCIGSFSCIKACPEGDIIGVIDGVATLIEGAHCIGHSRCAIECPVGAVRLVFGTAERGIDLPETDDSFESSRPGVFIVGELGGMGLIKNALRQGLDVGKALKKRLKSSDAQGTLVDVVIVGGGPAGIATAASCKEQGLVARIFEQESVGGCVAQYPRGKVVMSEQVILPYYGRFGSELLSKEELLTQLQRFIAKAGVKVEEGQKVIAITGDAPTFTVKTQQGVEVHARAVVLATGLRGSPRKMGCKGEDLPKVTYRLIDPEQYHDKRVLVVGGGDSAVEAAIQLAEESTAKVSISYRQDSFSRCKQRNRVKIQELIDEGRIRPLLSTEVTAVEPGVVRLKTKSGEEGVLKNDGVIVSIGGELPAEFLKGVGIEIRKFKGEEKGQKAGGTKTKADVEAASRRRLAIALFSLGAFILLGLMLVGGEYYMLPAAERFEHPLHEYLRPAGAWGHGVGIGATVFMMANFIYVLRKRWRPLKGKASIRTWLTFHMFVGIMSPLVIAFHATFLLNNALAVWTWLGVGLVVGTGIFGRFLFGLVPAQAGKLLAINDIRQNLNDLEKKLAPRLTEATDPRVVQELFERAAAVPDQRTGFFRMVALQPKRRRTLLEQIGRAEVLFADKKAFQIFRDGLLEIARLRLQVAFYLGFKRLFRGWLAVHVVLAVAMVGLIAAHIGVSLALGFHWIFSSGSVVSGG